MRMPACLFRRPSSPSPSPFLLLFLLAAVALPRCCQASTKEETEALTRWSEDVKDFSLVSKDSQDVAHLLVGPDGHIDRSLSPITLKLRVRNMTLQRQFFAVPSPIHGAQVNVWDGQGWKKQGVVSAFILQTKNHDSVLTAEGGQLTGLIRKDGLLLDLKFSPSKSRSQTRGSGGAGVRLQVTAKDAGGVLPKGARRGQVPPHLAHKIKARNATRKANTNTHANTEKTGQHDEKLRTAAARRLDLAPDDITQWTNCYTGETTTKVLEMGIILAPKLYLEWSSQSIAEAFVASMIVKTNMVYVPQFNVALEVTDLNIITSYTGAPSYTNNADCSQDLDNDPTELDAFSAAELDDTGLWHLLDNCFDIYEGGTTGLAWVAGLCEYTVSAGYYYNRGVTWHNTDTWLTFAHEVGHNFGAQHTFDQGGIMDYDDGMVDGIYQFYSAGNEEEMCAEIASVVGSCSYVKDLTTTCGDGVQEAIEDCECSDGSTSCTNCTDCVLDDNAQCSPDSVSGSQCCTSDGQFAGPSTTCTDWEGETGYCSDGVCYSVSLCTLNCIGDYSGVSTSNSCRYLCSDYSADPITSTGGTVLNNFPDGTLCGATGSGTCTDGVCSESDSASSYEQSGASTVNKTQVALDIQSAAGTAARTVEGCTGYSGLIFSGSADLRLARSSQGYSFEDCQAACQEATQCGAFSHSNSTQECHLWTANHLIEKLTGSSKFDTYTCPGWASAPDCEAWSNMVPGRHGNADAKKVECTSCASGSLTLDQCDQLCKESSTCHVFSYGTMNGVEGYCSMWDASTTLADLMPAGLGNQVSTYFCPCRGENKVCDCRRSRVTALAFDCRCDGSAESEDCSAGSYCYSSTCHSEPLRRLDDCSGSTSSDSSSDDSSDSDSDSSSLINSAVHHNLGHSLLTAATLLFLCNIRQV